MLQNSFSDALGMAAGFAAVGWLGAIALLTAYALVSTGRISGQSAGFQAMNLLGAAGLAANSGYHHAWPSVALNAVWIVVGLAAMANRGSKDAPAAKAPAG